MGMLGAMGGLGTGMSRYSETLGDKRKLDWEASQNDLKYTREMNLEDLRNTRSIEAEKRGETRQINQEGRLAERQDTMLKGERAYQQEQKVGDRAYADTVRAEDRAYDITKLTSEISARSKASLDSAVGIANATQALTQKQRKTEAQAYKDSEGYKSADPKTRESILFAIEHPETASILATQAKSSGQKEVTPEVFNKAYNTGVEKFDSLSKEDAKIIKNRLADQGIVDHLEQQAAFARAWAENSTNINKIAPNVSDVKLTVEQKTNILADAEKGLIPAKSIRILEKEDPKLASQVKLIQDRVVKADKPSAIANKNTSQQEVPSGFESSGNSISGMLSTPFKALSEASKRNKEYLKQ